MNGVGIPEWVMWLGAGAGSMLAALVVRLGWKSAGGEKVGNQKNAELVAALVDSSSVDRLTAAIEGLMLEMMTTRKERKDEHHMKLRRIEDLTNEVEELRRVVGNMTNEIARRK